jgi:predicted transposase/invertase (TIGR01784 family)
MLLDLNANYPTFEETPFYQELVQRGMEKGVEKGKKEGILLTAERMLRQGFTDEVIISITNISLEELSDLKRQITL